MTEHTKFPLPPEGNPGTGADSGAETGNYRAGGSLIERASKTFDFTRLSAPPVPRDLAPAVEKPAVRNRRAQTPAAPAPTVPVQPDPVAGDPRMARADDPVPQPQPVPRQPESVRPAPLPEAIAPIVTRKAAPEQMHTSKAEFGGAHYPVDREHLREQGLIVPEGTVTALLEEFRIVKRQLLLQAAELKRQGEGAASQRVLVCSPHPGEGKTYCAVNLALSIASERESEVLLVDADFAKPSVLSSLGLPGGRGLMDALTDPRIDVLDCVIGTDIPGLWVLPAGSATNSDSEYLASSRTRPVLDRLTEGAAHRMVIFDSPPALAASPAAELAKYVGQALVVARADRTGQGALEDAISLLSACPNIQLILNAVNFSPSGRKFGTYYGYGG